MSRVRVLNLPRTTTEDDLRQHFSQPVRGSATSALPLEITDCRVVRNATSHALRMAFVGFRTAAAGQRAIKLFNGSYIGAQKITVEIAQSLVEQRALRDEENEKRNAARNAYREKRLGQHEADDAPAKKGPMSEQDKLKAEFIERTVAQSKPAWSSEILQPTAVDISRVEELAAVAERDAERVEDLEAAALQRQKELEAVDDADFLAGITSETQKRDVQATASATEATVNKDFVAPTRPNAKAEAAASPAVPKAPRLTPEQQIALESGRVRLANIPYTATTAEVKNFVASIIGDVAEVHLPLTKDTKQVKGVAFVSFGNPQTAVTALKSDGAIFMGRLIRITAAPPDPYKVKREEDQAKAKAAAAAATAAGGADADLTKQNFKAERLDKKKRNDGDLMWNPLFVHSATAVAKVANQLNVGSDAMITVDSAGAAVRAAIAEAYLTSEAQRVLGDEGINLGALEGATLHRQRSNTTILVKHLPKAMSVKDLAKAFAQFGVIEAVAAPSSAAFALVSFVHESDAIVAFQKMAYKMVGGTPLFLEWAPIGAMKEPDDDELEHALRAEDENDASVQLKKAAKASHNDARGALGLDDDEDDLPPLASHATASTAAAPAAVEAKAAAAPVPVPVLPAVAIHAAVVYITNLPFGISEPAFINFLQSACKRLSVTPALVVKVSLLNTKGRAYVTLADLATANYVIAKVNGRSIEGRPLSAVLSTSSAPAAAPAQQAAPAADGRGRFGAVDEDVSKVASVVAPASREKPSGSSSVPADRNPLKVVVKNLPFEATEKDLRELFKAFSEVRAVRVPNKVNTFSRGHHENNHRGFGFVEFLTEQEAARAIATLSNTHLYGRHLVLEYAKL